MALLASLAACGGDDNSADDSGEGESADDLSRSWKTITIPVTPSGDAEGESSQQASDASGFTLLVDSNETSSELPTNSATATDVESELMPAAVDLAMTESSEENAFESTVDDLAASHADTDHPATDLLADLFADENELLAV